MGETNGSHRGIFSMRSTVATPPSLLPRGRTKTARHMAGFLAALMAVVAMALASAACTELAEAQTDPSTDRVALVALYNATDGPNWSNETNWLSAEPIGEWHGVTTDGSGRVTALDLDENELNGKMPSELGNLSNLQRLYLNDNSGLSGPLPGSSTGLTSLTYLDLSGTGVCAPTDASFQAWLENIATRLGVVNCREQTTGDPLIDRYDTNNNDTIERSEVLAAIDDHLFGGADETISRAEVLRLIDLHLFGPPTPTATTTAETDRAALIALYNATDGPNWNKSTNWLSDMPLTTWYGVATHNGRVVWLDLGVMFGERGEPLGSNNLSGTIPAEIGNLTNLKVLRLQDNDLSGPIPAEIGNLTNLEQLQLQNNSLSGTIPPEIGNLTNLEHLYLYKNDLTGSIPAEIGDLAGLVRLSLFHNDLEAGPIPVEFHKLVNLEALTLDTRHCAPQELEPWLRTQRFDVFPCTGPEENRLLPRVLLREDSEGLSLALEDDLHDPLMVNVSDKAVVTVAIQNGWLMLSPRGRGEAEVEIVPRSGGTPATATVLVREAVGTFGIDVVMAQPTTDLFAETMAVAADRWSTVLNGTEWNGRDARDYCERWKNNVPVSSSGNELVIWAVRETDRSYSAGGTGWGCRRGEGPETEPSHYYPVAGIITVNARLAHSSADVGLIRHEIGHLLGLTGSFPPATGLVAEDWKYFVGPRAVAVFREGGGDPDLPGIPLSGRSHWSPGGPDVMLNAHNSDALSVAALADAGYTVDMSKTIPWRHGRW